MHSYISDSDMENWHDFEVTSPREITALLRSIGEKNQLIRMLVAGESDVCVTSILEVDAEGGNVILDCSISPDQNRRILGAKRLSFETTLDKIRIMFGGNHIESCTFEGSPAFKMLLPTSLIRLQRREFYRMATPVTNPVRALIPQPAELGGGSKAFPLADISCGGIAILDNSLVLGDTIGKVYSDCRIELPEIGTITTGLQIRNSLDLTLLNNNSNRR